MNHLFIEFTIRATLIAACTAIVLRAARIRSAAARHRAWTSVMLLMLLLPLWIVWGPKARIPITPFLPSPADTVSMRSESSAETVDMASSTAIGQGAVRSALPPVAWQPMRLALGIYVIGVFTLLIRLGVGTIRAHRLARRAVFEEGRLTHPSCAVPITLGPLRPVTLLPPSWRDWSQQQLDVVSTHEREHVRRRDPLVQWLALLNRAVFWFHPLAWWLEHQLSFLAEQACDDAVLASGHDPHDYSEYLLAMERIIIRSRRRLKLIGVAMSGSFLPKRIKQILEGLASPPLSRKQAACAVASCAISCGLLAAGTLEPKPGIQRRVVSIPLVEYASREGAAVAATVEASRRPEPISTMAAAVSMTPTLARPPYVAQAAPPKWAGTWTLNKEKSNFGQDPGIQAMRDSIESATVKLEGASEGVTFTTDISLVRPIVRQHTEFALKFGVSATLNDVNPFVAMAYPGTLTIVPMSDNVLNLTITYANGSGSSIIRFEISSDGNTLTESLLPDDLRIVFDRQS